MTFDPKTGYFEWTPGQDIVNNATATEHAVRLHLLGQRRHRYHHPHRASARVRREPSAAICRSSNHAVVVGQAISLPVQLGATSSTGIVATDPDGAAQTPALHISFTDLPEGASYDATTSA